MATQAIVEQYQHPRVRLTVGNTVLYEDSIASGSFSYKAGTSSGGAFGPGGCVIASCGFTVINSDGSLSNIFSEGTAVAVAIGYGPTAASAAYEDIGTVYVANIKRRNYRVTVECYDKLRDADKVKWSTYSFPMTVNQIIQSAATEAGITVGQLPVAGGTISVDLRDVDGNQPTLSMTCRQAIAAALLVSGNYGYMGPANTLVCGWYPATADVTLPVSWLFDYSISDSQAYTGVQVAGQAVSGTSDRLYVLSSSAFLTEDNKVVVQSRLYDALVGLGTYIATVKAVCNPAVRPGQVMQISGPQAGGTFTASIPITDVVITGTMLATYSSQAVSGDTADDMRTSSTDVAEDVAAGTYPTRDEMQQAIDDAISGGGGGGGGGEWVLITSTIALFSRYASRGIDQPGASTGWMIDDANGFQTINLVGEEKQIHLGAPAAGGAWGDKTWQQIPDWQESYGKTFILPIYMDVKMDAQSNAEVYSGIVEMPCKFYGSTEAAYNTNAGRTIEMLYDPVHPPMVVAAPKQTAMVGMVGLPFAPMRSASQGASRAAVKYLNYTGRDPGNRDTRVFSFDWHVNPA